MTETDKRRPLVRDLYENRLSGEQIEKLSFRRLTNWLRPTVLTKVSGRWCAA